MQVLVLTAVALFLSTIVLNSRDQPKNNGAHNLHISKTYIRLEITYQEVCLSIRNLAQLFKTKMVICSHKR